MSETQTIFTVFFAISWGVMSNVLPKWKPFHYAMFGICKFCQPTRRIVVAFMLFNVLPWTFFVVVLFGLWDDKLETLQMTGWIRVWIGFKLIMRAIVPGMAPFGFYRLWLATIQIWPKAFYAATQREVPCAFRSYKDPRHEPSLDMLRLNPKGWRKKTL